MQVSLTATSGLERRLEVAVPAQRVASEVAQRLKKLSRTARLKGFRPGKAPLQVIQKQFGEQVHAEAVGDLMRTTFAEAVTQEKLKPAAGPRIEPLAVQPGEDLKYAAVFEVLPDVKLKPLAGLKIEKPVASITDADVDAMLESMRKQRPIFARVERAARETDRVTIDYHMHGTAGADQAHQHDHDVNFIVGAGRVMPELDQAVKGLAAGESRSVSVPMQGSTAEIHFTVKKVEEQSLPEMNDEFFQAFGVKEGGLEALRSEVRTSMNREVEGLTRDRLRSQVMDALYRDNPLELPRALVDEQVQQQQLEMGRRMGAKDVSQLPPREPFEEPARRRVALGFLLSEIVRSQNIRAERDRVLARLNEMAASYPNADEVRRTYTQNPDALRQIESVVLEDQALDWVLAQAQITEMPVSFAELTGFGQSNEPSSSRNQSP
jgi:trigger factor